MMYYIHILHIPNLTLSEMLSRKIGTPFFWLNALILLNIAEVIILNVYLISLIQKSKYL